MQNGSPVLDGLLLPYTTGAFSVGGKESSGTTELCGA